MEVIIDVDVPPKHDSMKPCKITLFRISSIILSLPSREDENDMVFHAPVLALILQYASQGAVKLMQHSQNKRAILQAETS